ncbi:MAG: PaaI family thioesterase [Rhodospirillales bacterium]
MLRGVAELRESGNIQAISDLIPYARTLGLEVARNDGGLVTILRFRQTNVGNHTLHLIHGGVVGALLEHAAIMHLLLETPVSVIPKVINLSVDFLRPVRGEDAFARGVIIRQGRHVANVRAQAWQGDPQKPVAAAHAHFLLK